MEVEPDVILLDLRMPVMDGFEAAPHIRMLPDGPELIIIAGSRLRRFYSQTPPQAELSILFDLAKRGNVRALIKQADKLMEQDADLIPFATQVGQLAKSFKLKEVQKILAKKTGETP